ncbi:MAG: hypothetical protein M1817_002406 [Caeruleum heppii]|nr:MAG: hypothetical protein M1817_002406 [Caeruleum heppii]
MSLLQRDKMETLLPQLLAFPPHPPPTPPLSDAQYDPQIRSVIQLLNKTSASVLVNGVKGGGDLLDIINPSSHSIPYLYTLLAHLNAQKERQNKGKGRTADKFLPTPGNSLWTKSCQFLEQFDSRQIRYAGGEWRRLIEVLAEAARAADKPLLAVHPLRKAILRLDPTSSVLTSNHVLFLRLCLEAKAYRAALPIIQRPIIDFPQPAANTSTLSSAPDQPGSSPSYITISSNLSARLSHTDHLEYHLYAAMLYIGLKEWELALELLQNVITAPTQATTSAIMVEAYKKWILVSLLHTGRLLPLPRTTNNTVAKSLHALSRPYEHIADVFRSGDVDRLRREIDAAQEIWSNDNNTGLILQIYSAVDRFAIRNLENTYSTLSLEEVFHHLRRQNPITSDPTNNKNTAVAASSKKPDTGQLDALERDILDMISSGQLNATLSHPSSSTDGAAPPGTTLLHFSSTPTSAHPRAPSEAETALLREVEEQTSRTIALTKQFETAGRKLALSREYVNWMVKTKKAGGAGGAGGGGPNVSSAMGEMMDVLGEDMGGVEEDVMADY